MRSADTGVPLVAAGWGQCSPILPVRVRGGERRDKRPGEAAGRLPRDGLNRAAAEGGPYRLTSLPPCGRGLGWGVSWTTPPPAPPLGGEGRKGTGALAPPSPGGKGAGGLGRTTPRVRGKEEERPSRRSRRPRRRRGPRARGGCRCGCRWRRRGRPG